MSHPFDVTGAQTIEPHILRDTLISVIKAAGSTVVTFESHMYTDGSWSLETNILPGKVLVHHGDGVPEFSCTGHLTNQWADAFETAFAQIANHVDFSWQARLAVVGRQEKTFAIKSAKVARFDITPTQDLKEQAMWEAEFSSFAIPHRPTCVAAQIDVQSSSAGPSWSLAQPDALQSLHQLQRALTVALCRPVEISCTPFLSVSPCATSSSSSAHPSIEVPQWVESFLLSREDGSSLPMALESFWEAERLRVEHPSFSIIGYVAAIESAGKTIAFRDKRRLGAEEAFREGLQQTGMDAGKVKEFEKRWYKKRSATAHAGKTHGDEKFGMVLPLTRGDIFDKESTASVVNAIRNELRPIANRVMVTVLSAQEPRV
jgi:hypothetical protein